MTRVLRRDAEAFLLACLAAEARDHRIPLTVEVDGVAVPFEAGTRRAAELGSRHLNRAQRRALGERGDGRHHPMANAMAIPRGR